MIIVLIFCITHTILRSKTMATSLIYHALGLSDQNVKRI